MSEWGSNPHPAPSSKKGSDLKGIAMLLTRLAAEALGWLLVAGSVVLIVSMLTGLTRPLEILIAQGMLPFVLVPAWFVLFVALFAKRWPLAMASVAVVIAHLLLVVPAITPDTAPRWVRDGPSFSLFVANVSFRNPTPSSVVTAVNSSLADVVVLNEVTDEQFELFAEAGVLDRYPTVQRVRAGEKTSEMIMTNLPVSEAGTERAGSLEMPYVTIDVPNDDRFGRSSPVKVMAVHVQAPSRRADVAVWKTQFRQLRGLADVDEPVVMAGDFNATLWHRPFRQLLGTGFVDSHDYLGDGLSRSWGPNWTRAAPFGAIMRLDHAITNGMVLPTEIGNREIEGSDHTAFRAEMVVEK